MRTRIQDGKGMLIPADPDPQACFLHFHLVFSTVLTRLGTGKKKDAAFLLLEIRFGRDSIRSLTKAIFQKFQDDRYHIWTAETTWRATEYQITVRWKILLLNCIASRYTPKVVDYARSAFFFDSGFMGGFYGWVLNNSKFSFPHISWKDV